jgi:hypothetical protein
MRWHHMENTLGVRRMLTSLAWSVASLGAVGLWLSLVNGNEVATVLGAATVVMTAILVIVWHSRARAARRFHAAVNAYAEREIDRERRRTGPPRARDFCTPWNDRGPDAGRRRGVAGAIDPVGPGVADWALAEDLD